MRTMIPILCTLTRHIPRVIKWKDIDHWFIPVPHLPGVSNSLLLLNNEKLEPLDNILYWESIFFPQ